MTDRHLPADPAARPELLGIGLAFVLGLVLTHPVSAFLLAKPPVFEHWFDQGQYLASARALHHGDLDPAWHWYPLLYPLLLAPLAGLPSLYQTGIVDLACYLVAYWGFREVARQFGVSGIACVVIFLLSTLAWPRLEGQWLMPWTTTPSAALIWLALAWTTRTVDPVRGGVLTVGRAAALGAVLALIPLGRPGDAPVSAVIGAIAVFGLIRNSRRWRLLSAMVAAGLVVAGAGVLLHVAIHGARPSPYMLLSAAYGANFAWTGWKAYLLLVEPRPWYPEGEGLLRIVPWLPFGLAGLLMLLADARRRVLGLLLLVPAAIYAAVMLAYIDLLPSGLWTFGNIHYFKWLFPALALGLVNWLACFRHRRLAAIAAVAPLLVLGALRFDPVVAAPERPARLLAFADVDEGKGEGANRVYFARSSITDARGPMRNYFEYHQVPAPGQGLVLAEALRRDFAGREVWYDVARDVSWPYNPMRVDPAPLPGAFPRVPVARFAPRLTMGWPCWLPPYGCPVALPLAPAARSGAKDEPA